MKTLLVFLVLLLVSLQYKLWVAPGGIAETVRLKESVHKQQLENKVLRQRNKLLEADVKDLKSGNEAIEGRARNELGMEKKGEQFYQILD